LDQFVAVHEADEVRAAGPAEAALRARFRLVRRQVVLAARVAKRVAGGVDPGDEDRAAVLAAVGAVAVGHVAERSRGLVADAAALAGTLVGLSGCGHERSPVLRGRP